MIKITHLRKNFKKKEVLKDINIDLIPGKVYALIAPNGTGKTTLISILCGFMSQDGGEIQYTEGMKKGDLDVILSGERNLYMKNTVTENLIYLSMLKGMSRIQAEEAIENDKGRFPLYDMVRSELAETLSYGQKRIISLMSAVVCGAKCIVIDEATDGLDMNNRKTFASTIRSVREGRIIVVVAHDFQFAAEAADTFLFLKEGYLTETTDNNSDCDLGQIYSKLYQGDMA